MSDAHPNEESGGGDQPLAVMNGPDAIARVERVICGDAVASEAAVAEGMAMVGRRAASLENGDFSGMGSVAGPLLASCVHHAEDAENQGPKWVPAFELAASTVQQAVDQSLVAHRLSHALGRAGLCSVSRSLLDWLDVVRLPGPGLVASTLNGAASKMRPAAGLEPRQVLELARAAFAAVGKHTGRTCEVVEYRGENQAEVVFVGAGSGASTAQEAAEALGKAGLKAASLAVALLRPFPDTEVERALSGAKTVFVVDDADLLAQVRAATAGRAPLYVVPGAGHTLDEPLAAVAKILAGERLDVEAIAKTQRPMHGQIAVAPASPWADALGTKVAAALAHLGLMRSARRQQTHLGAAVVACRAELEADKPLGLLLASHVSLLDVEGPLSLLRPGSAVVVQSSAADSVSFARSLRSDQCSAILAKELKVYWIDALSMGAQVQGAGAERAVATALSGAAVSAVSAPEDLQGAGVAAVQRVAERMRAEGNAKEAEWLLAGAKGACCLDAGALKPEQRAEEVDFRPATAVPRMPEARQDPEEVRHWAEVIRRFHATGYGALSAAGPLPGLPVRPAALAHLGERARETAAYPLVLTPSQVPGEELAGESLAEVLLSACSALQSGGAPARELQDNLDGLRAHVAYILRGRESQPQGLRELVREAGDQLSSCLGLPSLESETLRVDLGKLVGLLPAAATVVELGPDTALALYVATATARLRPRREAFVGKVRQLREQLDNMRVVERMHAGEGRTPEALTATLGRGANTMLDAGRLAEVVSGRRGSEPLSPQRRRRIDEAVGALEKYLSQQSSESPLVWVHAADVALPSWVPGQARYEHQTPLVAAEGLFDGSARGLEPVIRAVRVAELEIAGAYREEVHDDALAELSWEACAAEELAALPQVVAVTTGRRLRQGGLGTLSSLLRSSRPVHVLVLDRVAAADETAGLSRYHAELGYLAIAHREAFVVQSALAAPQALLASCAQMAQLQRPAVAVLCSPVQDPSPQGALRADAAVHGRMCTQLSYDPDAGLSWRERFSLAGNPQPEKAWPTFLVPYAQADGSRCELEVAFTFADAAALEPAFQTHFRLIPTGAWDDGYQLEMARFLEQMVQAPERLSAERAVPFVWVVDEQGSLQRAVVSRELTLATRDRLGAWRTFQELGGFANAHVEHAALQAREEAAAEVEQRITELEAKHAADLDEVRASAAHASMERLAASLLNMDTGAILAPAVAAAPAAAPGAAEQVVAAEAPAAVSEPEEEETLSFDEPFIDTPLCTSCNECTNLNPAMFKYNADKQVVLADAGAGTFAELVKAAVACPARCIHPGKPRAGDATATSELIEKAAAYN